MENIHETQSTMENTMFLGLLFNLSIWTDFKNGLDICHGPNGPVYGPNDVLVQVLLEKRKISRKHDQKWSPEPTFQACQEGNILRKL